MRNNWLFRRAQGVAGAAAGMVMLLALGSCGLEDLEVPEFSGPSTYGLGIRLTASPDIIVADGFSSSLVTANLSDPDGRPLAGRDIFFSVSDLAGNFADIGQLRSTGPDRGLGTGLVVRTDGSGAARVAYVAPPRTDHTGNGAVIVAVRPVGDDARGQTYRTVEIELRTAEPRLFPPGGGAPACSFIVEAPNARCDTPVPSPTPSTPTSPTPVPTTAPPAPPAAPQICSPRVNTSVLFQTTSSPPAGGIIVRYQWFFGDGSQPDYHPDTNHVFRFPGTYAVTHVVTSNTGGQSACQASITVIP